MDTCRAAVITKHNKPMTIAVPIPQTRSGYILVKITASTLCAHRVHRGMGRLQ